MKAIFISYNLALEERVMQILDRAFVRGFTQWERTLGRGSHDGEPHFANHAWPAMNSSLLTIVEEKKVDPILEALRELDNLAPQHGLRAFVWNVENQL